LNKVDLNKFEFAECKWSSVSPLFKQYHYLKRQPAGIMACYGLFRKDGLMEVVGGAVFCNGRIQYDKIYLEFSRLWISDELGKNAESYFISKCLKDLKKKFKTYMGIVTWADTKQNHNGTVYLASNFTYDGESRKVKKYMGNNKIIYQRSVTDNNHKFIGYDIPKKRFIYYFDNKQREKLKNT